MDVGANIGLFSLAAAKRVGRWGRVIAFEADAELAEICRSSAEINWFRNIDVIGRRVGEWRDRVLEAPEVSGVVGCRFRRP